MMFSHTPTHVLQAAADSLDDYIEQAQNMAMAGDMDQEAVTPLCQTWVKMAAELKRRGIDVPPRYHSERR
jgi:predicted restriction endonuclease